MQPILALIALAFDAAVGYPQWLYRAAGHPVTWIGRLLSRCELAWNRPALSFARRRFNGALTLLACIGVTLLATIALVRLIDHLLPSQLGLVLLGAVAGTLIAQRSLYDHVAAVAYALENGGLQQGRSAVSMIVGRDTTALDEHGIARAAIESLAENFSDGVVAPTFWLVVGGLPGCALYKTVNTADSMIGHKNERYRAFGWAAARLDDILNLPASRLSALLITAAAIVLPRASARAAWAAVARDARHHRSPNAGWPEAAVAGALGLRLAGPRVYRGIAVEDRWMGEGRAAAGAGDIRRALALYRCACAIQAAAVAALAIILISW
jgi:adenosylcobinamide-phosphate synthase